MRRPPLPTDRWVRALLPVALIFVAAGTDRNYQTDLWHHLARGRAIVARGGLVDVDLFTYTVHGQPLRDVNWGWQVLFFRLWQLGGLALVQTVNAVLLAAMMAGLVALAWRRSGSLPAAAAACVFAFFGLWQLLLIRPQTLSLLLFVLLLAALEAGARDRRWLLAPPLLLAVWVNVHGGFPIGLVLVAAYTLAELLALLASRARPRPAPPVADATGSPWPMLLCAGACAVATLANPYGWGVYEYVLQTTGRAAGRGIDEWLPPGLTTLTGKVWALSLVALVVLLGRSDRRPTVRELCCLAFLLPLACGSVRMVAWWLLAATPVLAAQAAGAWPRLREAPGDDRPGVGAAVACAALAAAMVLSAPALEAYSPVRLLPGRDRRTEDDLQAVADYLAAGGRGGRLFTRFAWAEYLGWALAPRWTVFMDGRIEIIPDHVWADYSALTRGRADWQELLDRYGVDGLVLDAHSGYDAGLLAQVRRSPRWRPVLEVGDAAVFERVTGHSEPGD